MDTRKVHFRKIALIGVGLIGSSIARGVRQHALADAVVGCSHHPATCEKIRALSLVDHVTTDPREAVRGADLIVLCTPVGSFAAIARAIAADLDDDAIVSDVGSVKQKVIKDLRKELGKKVRIVPVHPVAGTEHSGPESGDAHLFENRWCIVTPEKDAAAEDVQRVSALWEALGMRVTVMDAQRHDRILAITSHLPHLIAYTIVSTAAEAEKESRSEVIDFAAGGFRDFTRIASSDPTMWRDIFLANQDAVVSIAERFFRDLEKALEAVRGGDGEALLELFTRGTKVREAIIAAGQDE